MGHQRPCSRPGPRVIAVEDEDVEQVLENDVKRRNEISYDFVGDVVRATGFPCVNLPDVRHLIQSGWISGSKGMNFCLVLLWQWAALIRRLRLSLPRRKRCSRFRW